MVIGLGHHHPDEAQAYEAVYEGRQDYDVPKSHEFLGGAAAFAAMRAYEGRREAEGHKDHALARELLAGLVGSEVEKLAEREGMEWSDKERMKQVAEQKAMNMYETSYTGGEGGGVPGAAGGDYGPGGAGGRDVYGGLGGRMGGQEEVYGAQGSGNYTQQGEYYGATGGGEGGYGSGGGYGGERNW